MKVALVGCGRIARDHAQLVKKITRGAELIFCDRNEDKARTYASQYAPGCDFYTDLQQMLESEKPEAVHVLTQPVSHFEIALAGLKAGAHVFIEKPVTETLAEFEALQALANNEQRILYPGYSTLGYPIVQRARDIIRTGTMGGLVSVHCNFCVAPPTGTIPYGNADHWAYFLPGGILQNVIDHPTSLLADSIDNPKLRDVCVLRRAELPQASPNLMHMSVYNDAQVGSFTLSYANGNATASVVYILEAGTITVDLRGFTMTTQYGAGPQSMIERLKTGMHSASAIGISTVGMLVSQLLDRTSLNPGVGGLISNFYSTINCDASPVVSSSTARNTVRLLEGVWTHAQSQLANTNSGT